MASITSSNNWMWLVCHSGIGVVAVPTALGTGRTVRDRCAGVGVWCGRQWHRRRRGSSLDRHMDVLWHDRNRVRVELAEHPPAVSARPAGRDGFTQRFIDLFGRRRRGFFYWRLLLGLLFILHRRRPRL